MFTLRETLARYKTVLLLLLALQLVRGVWYGAVVPPWQAPDETWHYEYVLLAYRQGEKQGAGWEFTLGDAEEMENSLRTFSFWYFRRLDAPPKGSFRPPMTSPEIYSPFYPLLLTPLYALASPLDVTARLLILRLTSVLLAMGTIFLAFLVAATIFPEDDALIVGIPAFILFLPMHTYITSMINSDNLAEFCASLALFLMITWFRDGLSLWRVSGAALAVALGVLTKRTAVFLIPLFLFAVALYAGRSIPREKKRWAILLFGLVLLVSLAFLALFILYIGPSLRGGILASLTAWGLDSESFFAAVRWGDFFNNLASRFQMTFILFWAAFGWVNVPLAWGWYRVLAAICLAVVIGLILHLFRLYRRADSAEKWRAEATVFLLIALLLAFLIGLAAMIFVGGSYSVLQGRYFFPTIIPVAALFLLGWRELFPSKYRRLAVLGLLAGLALFDAMAMGYYIIPFYYS